MSGEHESSDTNIVLLPDMDFNEHRIDTRYKTSVDKDLSVVEYVLQSGMTVRERRDVYVTTAAFPDAFSCPTESELQAFRFSAFTPLSTVIGFLYRNNFESIGPVELLAWARTWNRMLRMWQECEPPEGCEDFCNDVLFPYPVIAIGQLSLSLFGGRQYYPYIQDLEDHYCYGLEEFDPSGPPRFSPFTYNVLARPREMDA